MEKLTLISIIALAILLPSIVWFASTNTPKSTPTASTKTFNPKLTATTITNDGFTTPFYIPAHYAPNGRSVSYSDIAIVPSENGYGYLGTSANGTVMLSSSSVNNRLVGGNYSFDFGVTVTNPITSMNSSVPYEFQFVITEVNASAASPSDAALAISVVNSVTSVQAEFGEVPTYYTIPLTANVNANTLTFLCNPSFFNTQQVSGGSIITSGFQEGLSMIVSFAVNGTFNLSINLVPAT